MLSKDWISYKLLDTFDRISVPYFEPLNKEVPICIKSVALSRILLALPTWATG